MLAYPALFEPDRESGGFVVTFPDLPEAVTQGDSEQEALEYARDVLVMCLREYVRRRRPLPRPRPRHGPNWRVVRVPSLAAAKLAVYRAMQEAGVRKATLARQLGWQKSQVDRLLDLAHASRLDQIEVALAALGKRLDIEIRNAA